jgi:2-polyprenyl-3-methyl-5-hydroxy-6-metoxy-1,4-benzoquinol methylase
VDSPDTVDLDFMHRRGRGQGAGWPFHMPGAMHFAAVKPTSARGRPAPPSIVPVPGSCYLCGGTRLVLRYPARGTGREPDAAAYHCTSFAHRSHPPIWGCLECGLLFQWPRRPEQEILRAYEEVVDPLYMAEGENRIATFRRAVRLLGPGRGRRLLDVGAYCGYFIEVAREAGFEAEGLELSRWAAGHARERGCTVHAETLSERARHGATYDVVTLWDVIEHCADPRRDLASALRLLRPGGRIYIATIDAGSLVARLLGSRWPWLMDMHLFYFDRASLPALLEDVGFRVRERRTYTHTVSANYFLRKVGASFPALAPVAGLLRRLVPSRWPVPVNLGDNMLVVAERP